MFIIILLIAIITTVILLILPPKQKNTNIKIKKSLNKNTTNETIKIVEATKLENKFAYTKVYRPKKYILTKNELKFYKVLFEIAKELDLILFTQVSLYNILIVNENLDYSTRTKYFNKIASKSIDFVLADKENCRIKLCIELDDKTHNKKNRVERDNFINELFKDLEINLLRYSVYNIYYKEILKRKIQENLK